MLEGYEAIAFWGVRPETPAECAERARIFFRELKRIDPSWGQWFRAGRRVRGAPGIPVNVDDGQELEELFRRGKARAGRSKTIIEDLGFSLWVWTERKERTSIQMHCGVYTPFSCNRCVVDLPAEGTIVERMANVPAMTQVLMCMTMAWDPEWALVNSDELFHFIPQRDKEEYPIGWIMYCSSRQGRVPPLPAPVRIERVKDKGTLITLTDERFTVSTPEHVARAVRVHELLDRAGLLMPRPG
jgi:hypothetical protein